jgi:DNA-binding NarL/FixJ family response regulator
MLLRGPGSRDGSSPVLPPQSRTPALEREFVGDVTILLADDNSAVLDHVAKILKKEHSYRVLAAIIDGSKVAREYLRLRPDVIILDISMGELSGIDIARQLRDSGCGAKIIFLTVHEDRDYVSAAIGAGGSAYVIKSRLSLDLLRAIKAVRANKLFVSASLMDEPG